MPFIATWALTIITAVQPNSCSALSNENSRTPQGPKTLWVTPMADCCRNADR